jgi:hypothetical protein
MEVRRRERSAGAAPTCELGGGQRSASHTAWTTNITFSLDANGMPYAVTRTKSPLRSMEREVSADE